MEQLLSTKKAFFLLLRDTSLYTQDIDLLHGKSFLLCSHVILKVTEKETYTIYFSIPFQGIKF
jgi:hypothetical protein